MEDVFLKLMFNILKIDTTFKIIYQFYLKKMKKSKIFLLISLIKLNVIHARNLKQALNHKYVLKKVYRVITYNQNLD